MKNNHKIVCIVGPTASGKTALGVEMATRFNGEIVSADSRQVFRKLNIGTNKEGLPFDKLKVKSEKLKVQVKNKKLEKIAENIRYVNEIPQWLIDICEPGKKFSMFDWLKQAKIVIEDIFERGKLPIVVGGTGLYFQALVEGFAFDSSGKLKVKSKKYKSEVKKYSRKELDKKTLEELQEIYLKFKIKNLKLDMQNPRRLIRAIERAQEGTCVSRKKSDFEALQIGIDIPREKLYEKIDRRVDIRFREGMLEEVAGLLKSGVDPKWLYKLGLEYRIISQYLTDNFKFKNSNLKSILNKENFKTKSFQRMAQELKWKSHAYARRQMTWFRRFPEIKWVKDKKEAEKLIIEFLN